MFSFAVIMQALFFSITMLLVLVLGIILPGFLLKKVLAPRTHFTSLEAAILSFALGIGLVDASLLILGKLHLPLNAVSISIWYSLLVAAFLAVITLRKIPLRFPEQTHPLLETKKEFRVALVLIVLIFFIKVFYLSGTVLPTATDLGHHLYWSKVTTDTQALPVYQKQEIIRSENDTYSLSEPTPISDFIIGEHLPLSFIHIFTGASYFGTFPLLFLFLLNLSSVFVLSLLLYRMGQEISKREQWVTVRPSSFFLLGLFVFGVLFSLASPEMKFVSGGVIGNLFGNFFIPLILLLLLRALLEKSAALFALCLVLIATLAYTHHLSTFVLLFVLFFSFLSLIIFWQKQFLVASREWLPLLWKPAPLAVLGSIILFAVLVALPTYIETNAVGTAVGTPTKDTRTGLTLAQISLSNSALKFGLALFGLILIVVSKNLRRYLSTTLLFGYCAVLLIMTMTPQLLLVDIPSTRIAHYLSFPLGLVAVFTLLFFFEKLQASIKPQKSRSFAHLFVAAGAVLTWLALVAPGLEDNGKTLSVNNQGLYVQETFGAADYLREHTAPDEWIVKDHNFIEASDTWMKLFFSRDYNYPLSRSFFKRYEDNPDREQCTLAMIATPNTPFGKKCYQDLPVRFLVVNPKFDQAQFLKSPQFSLVYSSANVAVFEYNKEDEL